MQHMIVVLAFSLVLILFWLLIDLVLALTAIGICVLFGRNPSPAQVPNKAIWG